MHKKKSDNPKLRFLEFEEEWVKTKIDKVAKVSSGGTPNRSRNEYWNGKIPWITTSLIDFNIIESADEFITDKGIANSSAKIFPIGTLLMAMYGQGKTRGKIGILGIEASTNQACGAIITKKVINNKYLFQNLSARYEEIRNLSNEGSQKNISGGIIKNLPISYPSLPEQQKIANFLTTIDSRLQSLEKKKSLLEQYKKGVMQQIFKQEIRFKDKNGQEFTKWENKKLGDVSSKKSSNIAANKIEENFGDFIIYGASGVLQKVDFYEEENDYISIVKDGAGVGRIFYCEGKTSVLGTMEIIKPKEGLNTYFLYCLLEGIDFKKYITGSTIPHIYFKDYKKENIGVPCIEEQTKIANFLSAIDKKIKLVDEQIEKTKTYKKGLLQQMFV